MKKIGVIANCSKPAAPVVLERLSAAAKDLDFELFTLRETVCHLPGARKVDAKELGDCIDVLVALGGDGTMLRAVRSLGHRDLPVMGVNLGSLGFMTSVPQEEMEAALGFLASGEYRTSERSLVELRVDTPEGDKGPYLALNDVVVGWGQSARVNTLNLRMDGDEVTSYVCDGLIVATPTGSTGHSLSAGGPILHPETKAFVVSVICPHALSHRPLVVPDHSTLEFTIADAPDKLVLSVDGQEELTVVPGAVMRLRRADEVVHFIHPPGYSYFSVLRQKLGWKGSSL